MKKTYEVMISTPADVCITVDADTRGRAIATALKEFHERHVRVYRAAPKERKKHILYYPSRGGSRR